jgi:hypothetical protein
MYNLNNFVKHYLYNIFTTNLGGIAHNVPAVCDGLTARTGALQYVCLLSFSSFFLFTVYNFSGCKDTAKNHFSVISGGEA